MNLSELLHLSGVKVNVKDTEVKGITDRADEVREGFIFAAIKGRKTDGSLYIPEVLSKGAAAVITEEAFSDERVLRTDDVRKMTSVLSREFFHRPDSRMTLIGVTGTNGKTTVAGYLRHILSFSGVKCGVIGTLGSSCDGYYSETGYTTPSAPVLFREMARQSEKGTEYLILEVSSQALSQKRVYPIDFSLGILTNIGSDHLDYHGSKEEYVSAKKSLFAKCENSLINADDIYCEEFTASAKGRVCCFSAQDIPSEYSAKNIRHTPTGAEFLFLNSSGICRMKGPMAGDIALYNTLSAASAAHMLGVPNVAIAAAVSSLPVIKGRLQCIEGRGIRVYIDFAHTPEALSSVLKDISGSTRGRLICVFGCGGNRDKKKRGVMGKIASENADTVILTSDNPRDESPTEIINDILKGIINKNNVYIEEDREAAITLALHGALHGDVVLIAGKGHEEYQLVLGEKRFFSDELTVRRILLTD